MCTLTKAEQRAIVREKLNNMSYFDRSFKSQMIVSDIINSRIINEHSHILLYKAMITEVNIDWLFEFTSSFGKQCYLPRVCGDEIELVKFPCPLQKGTFGILEPIGESVQTNIDLCFVPVLAVDKHGNRLGKVKDITIDFLLSFLIAKKLPWHLKNKFWMR